MSRAGLALLMMALGAPALAAGDLDVTTTVTKQEVFVDESGEEQTRLVPAETVAPGERVVYTITVRNTGDEAAGDVVVTNPINDNLTYVEGSAFGPGMTLEFSVDGGVTFAAADELTVEEQGSVRVARPKDFTHVRWVLQNELAAGAQGMARFAAVLD